jgi:RNA recognition motif-containing protein
MSVSLFIGNLPFNATEGELRDLFSTVGSLLSIYLPTDRESGKLRGFAFIEYQEPAHAAEAIRRFDQQLYKGRPLRVTEARARESRPRTGAPAPTPAMGSRLAITQEADGPQLRRDKPERNFGPDAAPRRHSKSGHKSERSPKRPMREVERSQFFGVDDDESFESDVEGENFASRESFTEDNE